MKNFKKNVKGITLIALVITIIILLILAGISIGILTGENGILSQAQKAKEKTEIATVEEQRQLTIAEATMNLNGTKYKSTYKGKEVTVPIPAGFAVSKVDGENTVEDGLVIIDSEGNEFVWIPVMDEMQYVRNSTWQNGGYNMDPRDTNGYLPDELKQEEKAEGEIEKEIVAKSKGFYIGRYEAGAEGGILEELEGEAKNYWKEEPKLVCKKGATIYNWISSNETKEKSKGFINQDDVKSALISGTQWDVVMKLINEMKDGKGQDFLVETYNKERHTGNQQTAGQNLSDKVYNIYDLEGNCCEYVAEIVNGNYVFSYRGGFYIKDYPACCRYHSDGSANTNSFRLVLYII